MALQVDASEHDGDHTVYTHGRARERHRTRRRPHCVHAWPCKWTPQNTTETTLSTRMAVQVDATEHDGDHTVYTHGRTCGRLRTRRRPHCVHAWPYMWTPQNTTETTLCTRMAVHVDASEHDGDHTVYTHGRTCGRLRTRRRPHCVHAWPYMWTPQNTTETTLCTRMAVQVDATEHDGDHTVYTHGRTCGRLRTRRRPHCVHAWPYMWTPQNTTETTLCTRMAVQVDASEHDGDHTVYTHGRASGRHRTRRRPHCVHAWPYMWTPQNTTETTLCTRMAVHVDASEHDGDHTVYTHGRASGRLRTRRRPHCVHAWPCKWTPQNTTEATLCTRMAVQVDASEHDGDHTVYTHGCASGRLRTRRRPHCVHAWPCKWTPQNTTETTLCTRMAVHVDASEHDGDHTVYTHGRTCGRLRTRRRPHCVHAWPCKWTPQNTTEATLCTRMAVQVDASEHDGGHTVYTHGRASGRLRTRRRPHCVHAWPYMWTPQNTTETTLCTRMAVHVDASEHDGDHTVYTHGRASGRLRTRRRPHCVHAWPCKWTPQNTTETTLSTRMAVHVDASEHDGDHTVYTHGRASGRVRTRRRPHCVHAWPCKWTPQNTTETTLCTRMALQVDASEHDGDHTVYTHGPASGRLRTRRRPHCVHAWPCKWTPHNTTETTLCTRMAVQVDASEHDGDHTVYTHGRASGRVRTRRRPHCVPAWPCKWTPQNMTETTLCTRMAVQVDATEHDGDHTEYTHGRASGRLRTRRRPHCVHAWPCKWTPQNTTEATLCIRMAVHVNASEHDGDHTVYTHGRASGRLRTQRRPHCVYAWPCT